LHYCVFDTALGAFGLGWTDKGIARAQLPGLSGDDMTNRIGRGGAALAEPPARIDAVIALVRDYALGGRVDFAGISLDFTGVPEFHRRAYDILVTIGYGEVTTYGAMARQLGDVTLSRAVGQAMGANPIPLIVPCHRVLASDGKPGGFSAPGGAVSKIRMLGLEGVAVGNHDPAQESFGF